MPLKIVPDVIGGQEIVELDPTASVRDAARLMAGRRIGSVLITDGGTLRGFLTERDVSFGVDAPSLDPDATELAGVMTVDPDTIGADETCANVLEGMRAENCRHLPILDGGRLVGIVSIRELYAVVESQLEEDFRKALVDRARRMSLGE